MQAAHLIKTLKKLLKQKNISYKDVANQLQLSESSVKRLFAKQSLSLSRIEQICELAQTDIFELVRIAEEREKKLTQMSFDQEQTLTQDPMLLLVAICLGAEMSLEDIAERFQMNNVDLISHLTKLDKLGIIDLLPNNLYRIKISRTFQWIPDGPLHRFFARCIAEKYFQQTLGNRESHLFLRWGIITPESAKQIVPKIERLTHEFLELEVSEQKVPANQKVTSSLLVLFRENWEPDAFKSLWDDAPQPVA